MRKMYSIGRKVKSAPLAIGAANIVNDCAALCRPLNRAKCSCGTNCGIRAFAADCCTPIPRLRAMTAANRIHMLRTPEKYRMATASVTRAIAPSEIFTRYLRLYLSAHTPANGETNTIGKSAAQVNIVIMPPDRKTLDRKTVSTRFCDSVYAVP
jgi:hypothetical protein